MPGTRDSGPPTWPSRTRTRCTGGRDALTSLRRRAPPDRNRGRRQFRGGRRGQPLLRADGVTPSVGSKLNELVFGRGLLGLATRTSTATAPARWKVKVIRSDCPGVTAPVRPVRVMCGAFRPRKMAELPGIGMPTSLLGASLGSAAVVVAAAVVVVADPVVVAAVELPVALVPAAVVVAAPVPVGDAVPDATLPWAP